MKHLFVMIQISRDAKILPVVIWFMQHQILVIHKILYTEIYGSGQIGSEVILVLIGGALIL